MWNSFFEKSSASAKFLMVCHSQGAIHVRNALLDYPPELRERIIVVAIAPGGYIYQQTCAQVIHYRNASKWRDFVPRIDKKGIARSKETIVDVILIQILICMIMRSSVQHMKKLYRRKLNGFLGDKMKKLYKFIAFVIFTLLFSSCNFTTHGVKHVKSLNEKRPLIKPWNAISESSVKNMEWIHSG